MGAVAYDAKVVHIWNGFRDYFTRNGLAYDYVLYSNYERQVRALLAGEIHVAWNSPLAWLQTEAAARAAGRKAEAIAMRDSDRDLTSLFVVREDAPIMDLSGLAGRRVAFGAADSPQARLIPLEHMARAGLEIGRDFEGVGFEIGVGLHGDHVGGEREAVRALLRGRVDAAAIIDGNYLAFGDEGLFPSGRLRVLLRTEPYDHCNFTMLDGGASGAAARFRELLLGMRYSDAALRPLLDMEGLKQWLPGRVEGYRLLGAAIERFGTLDAFLAETGR
jgi:ABC-type phosphate/phosphonate transport system substrate-binding protein